MKRIGLVGCGTMGAGLAELCARAGLDVRVLVSSEGSAHRGRTRIARSLDRAVGKGQLDEAGAGSALAAITFTRSAAELSDRQLVIESVPEDEALKRKVFAELDAVLTDPDTVLATNTSSVRVGVLAEATSNPDRVVGMHFFNPVRAMPLVEIVAGPETAGNVVAAVAAFATDVLGKQVVRSGDRTGFVVNALLVPYLLAAVRMVGTGHATPAAVDRAMRLGCSHPLGPLELTDLIGLDVIAAIAVALHTEFGEPLYAPPALLAQMIDAGRLGRKTGSGFFEYAAS
ncbi:3-hydroxybutyryl-CoA dehydrogenase [Winogradskya humida]|uniref:3-hydroxybutyryl-CoA dehydrogenase n=1 Tax=Winogradskya humida TaxID=113566 RepID=A0ABQ4A5L0_9ACTN|nr:3-hydroxybutyryl-CoA dehydrogenase [Actinoplanes humidus]GIE26145.1 putative 3-hydroxybutyryl-CoA dehydrogenase [Actinoplanes humidus]